MKPAVIRLEDYLEHYGTPHEGMIPHSGRYPYGSGDDPYSHPSDLLARINELEKEYDGKETEVAKALGMSTTELRKQKSIAKDAERVANIARVRRLKDHGCSNLEIQRRTGIPEATVRNYLKDYALEKANLTQTVADKLEGELKAKKYLDIGKGSETYIGCSANRLQTAVEKLKDKGYFVDKIRVEQAGNPGHYTTVKVLGPPGTTQRDLFKNLSEIKALGDNYTTDGGKTWKTLEPPANLDSSRLKIRYAEEGGKDKDGVIELRRGLDDLNLGNSQYAQVRIAVDGTHYLKGMAMYSDNMPSGIDVIFNTNKTKDVPMIGPKDNSVLKPLKDDPNNPFGALIKENKYDRDGNLLKASGQYHYIGKDGKEHLSPINKVKEEGEWDEWDRNISSQFLSKQKYGLAKQQLDITLREKKAELQEIQSIPNPAIRKALLKKFADSCDSDSVHLKAAALPRQSWKVILPITGLKETEVYAPTYKNGEEVVLVRYPHGGTFEIPRLIVNNNNLSAKAVMKNAPDAIGINASVAQRLSGADFDGDTVLVIPTKNTDIKTTAPLEGLKDFEPSERYKKVPGMKVMSEEYKQNAMGQISNLITDMTIQGAKEEELARAVRHSMVVIDAPKHELNYVQSYKDNGIEALKKKYQLDPDTGKAGGASTLISRAKSKDIVRERKIDYYPSDVNPDTGVIKWRETGRTYIDYKTGKVVAATTNSTKMAEHQDARELISAKNTKIEQLYASHANNLKALANEARKEWISTKPYIRDPSATKTYSDEVKTLQAKLDNALANSPRERQAQLIANSIYLDKVKQYNITDKKEKKNVKTQALAEARARTGAISRANRDIDISDREWEAIQAHAISNNKLESIIENADLDALKARAMPRSNKIPSAKISLIKSLAGRYTQAEIAAMAGVSASTVSKVISGKA